MTDPNNMEDPQAGEILPPMLYEAWWACVAQNDSESVYEDELVKRGMECACAALKPLMQAALPYFEAGVRDTRMGPADAGKLAELAAYQEVATYEN